MAPRTPVGQIVPVRTPGAHRASADRAEVTVELQRSRVRGLFIVMEAGYGVLGRNVLNALRVLLDGPEQEWTIEK